MAATLSVLGPLQAENILQNAGGEHDALDILYYLEIQELAAVLRIMVNTAIVMADPEPDCWQKMEWVGEARVVLRKMCNSPPADDEQEALRCSLEEKIRAAERVVRNQMGFEDEDDIDEDASYNEDEEDEYEEDDEEDKSDEEL